MKDAEYYADHAEEFDALPEEERMNLLVSGFVGNDEQPVVNEEVGTPEPEITAEEDVAEPVVEQEEEPHVVAKDGKTKIPFSELQDAREAAKQWKELAERYSAQLTQKEEIQNQEPSKSVRELRTEARKALIEGDMEAAASLDEQADQLLIAQAEQRAIALIAPIQKNAQEIAAKSFEDALRSVHPDYKEMIETGKIENWIASQPKIVQKAYMEVYESGNVEDSIALLSLVKEASKPVEQKPNESLAAAAIAKAKTKVPSSLSEVPAGTHAPVDEIEAFLQKDGMGMVEYFNGKTQDQINTILAKLM